MYAAPTTSHSNLRRKYARGQAPKSDNYTDNELWEALMSVADNPGPDDPFFDSMREQLADIKPSLDTEGVKSLDLHQLAEELARVHGQLRELNEMHKVKTQQGRE